MFIIDVSFTPDVAVAFISLLDICAYSCFPVVALSHFSHGSHYYCYVFLPSPVTLSVGNLR